MSDVAGVSALEVSINLDCKAPTLKDEHSITGIAVGPHAAVDAAEAEFKPAHQVLIDEGVRNSTLMALRFAVFADALNSQVLAPNYPTMCLPKGASPK